MGNKTILATGADIKNKFLLAKGKNLYFGPDIGDLANTSNYEKFKKEIIHLLKKIHTKPQVVACDLHPAYFSVKFAKENKSLFDKNYKLIQVQHHHAHIASVLAETGISKPVIGIAFDGTGFGSDGNFWGGDFFVIDKCRFNRLAHFKYRMMPGGDKVVYEPWRMLLSIIGRKGIPFLRGIKRQDIDLVLKMMSKNINSPLSSSVGRLFDAVSVVLGMVIYASYEAEGPIKLEKICDEIIEERYNFEIIKEKENYIIDVESIFLDIIKDLNNSKSKNIIATKFHNSMVEIIIVVAKKIYKEAGIKNVVLSGGVFQNNFLRKKVIEKLLKLDFQVFTNKEVPVNDLNISLGQYYVSCCTCKS